MARYQTLVNVWDPSIDLSKLQPGQWVECGKGGDRAIWCGQRRGCKTFPGSNVVAHVRYIQSSADPSGYIRNLLNYAKG